MEKQTKQVFASVAFIVIVGISIVLSALAMNFLSKRKEEKRKLQKSYVDERQVGKLLKRNARLSFVEGDVYQTYANSFINREAMNDLQRYNECKPLYYYDSLALQHMKDIGINDSFVHRFELFVEFVKTEQ